MQGLSESVYKLRTKDEYSDGIIPERTEICATQCNRQTGRHISIDRRDSYGTLCVSAKLLPGRKRAHMGGKEIEGDKGNGKVCERSRTKSTCVGV